MLSHQDYVNTSCLAVPDDEDGVRDALRGMLRSIGALQDLGHSDGEWESIVPEDVVPDLADPQARRYNLLLPTSSLRLVGLSDHSLLEVRDSSCSYRSIIIGHL